MFIHKSGIGFCCHPRTASHSISKALVDQLGFEDDGENYHLGPKESGELVYFCVVRNHWDTMVSWWFKWGMWRENEKLDVPWLRMWADWYRRNFKLRRKLWYLLYQDLPLTVIRFEDLEQGLDMFLSSHGLPMVELPHIKTPIESEEYERKYHPCFYHTKETKEWVEEHFKEEIEELDFHWGEGLVSWTSTSTRTT